MADLKLIEILKQGSDTWNSWRKQQPEDVQIDLSMADLSEAKLNSVDLNGAYLWGAKLSGAYLYGANLNKVDLSYSELEDAYLIEAELSNADLTWANLTGTDLGGAILRSANLSRAILRNTDLSEADLNEANLSDAILARTIFARTNLRSTIGLTQINHECPSYIELHTVQLPQDGSALHFLRGAGVPDEWIDDYRAHMMHPIQYHSCFISYSSKDDQLAHLLHADLQAQGVRCWFAPEDMKTGDKFRSRIDEAIHVHEKLLLLLSEYAIKSDWVEDEVETALEKEKLQQREVLFPIRLDDAVMETDQAWAAKLRRQRHIGDFTRWREPAYQQAFERLLQDLKKADEQSREDGGN
jgi:TIR domain/Pentapeptide repeats (8 copies)